MGRFLTLLLILVVSLGAAKQPWHKGTLMESPTYHCADCPVAQFVIGDGERWFTVEHVAHLTTPDFIEFSIRKGRVWIRDSQGHIHEMRLVREKVK